MPTRNISLTDHFDRFVEENVSSGSYQNASEVVREGLRLLQQKKIEDRQKLAELRRAAREGFAQIDAGDFYPVKRGDVGKFIAASGKRPKKRAAGKTR